VSKDVRIRGYFSKPKGVREGEKKNWNTGLGEEEVKHVLLNCSETRNRRTEFLNKKALNMNEEIVCRKIVIY
jgi:hypothetical protein